MPDNETTRICTAIDALPEVLFTTNRAPSDYELNVARALIQQSEERIRALYLNAQSSDLDLLRGRLTNLMKVVSPIRRVPEDIIRKIFLTCLHLDSPYLSSMSKTRMPSLLTYISSGLRKIAIDTPSLWASFHIEMRGTEPQQNGSRPVNSQADAVREWLRRSQDLSLCISVTHTPTWSLLFREAPPTLDREIMKLVFSCHARWKDISFETYTKDPVLPLLQRLTPTDVPRLQSIEIDSHMWSRKNLSDFLPMPLLASRHLRRTSGFSFSDLNAYSPDFPLANLTHLDCQVRSRSLEDIAYFTRTIGQCLSLVSLKFTLTDHYTFTAISSAGIMRDTVHLPRLRSLLADEHHTLVSPLITAPRLESFYQCNKVLGGAVAPSIMTLIESTQNITILGLNTEIKANLFVEILRCCPQLKTLLTNPYLVSFNGEAFECFEDILAKFTDGTGPLCPKLETFFAYNMVVVHDDIFREFLLRKLDESSHFAQWKKVFIQVSYDGSHRSTLQAILDEFSWHPKIELELHRPHFRSSSTFTGFSYELYLKYSKLTNYTV